MSTIAIIPARGGSKRIPRKNVRLFCGKPMIAWSIEAVFAASIFDAVVVSTDDEAFTYNKRISRLSSVQEHKMIRRAIERGVPEEKIAKALDVNPESIRRKVRMLNGICDETVAILKDKSCPMAVFEILRKMNPLRQIEAAELLVNANNYSVAYASAILPTTSAGVFAGANRPVQPSIP